MASPLRNEPDDPQAAADVIMRQFYCPLSHNIMKDPVIADDGHSYERALIEKWQKNTGQSPLTLKPMSNAFEPNGELKSHIERFKNTHCQAISDPQKGTLNQDNDSELLLINLSLKGKIASTLRSIRSGAVVAVEAIYPLLTDLSWQPPQIVVVGAESHGKSTILERLLGLPLFPRFDHFCTRVPIRVQLRRGVESLPVIAIAQIDPDSGLRVGELMDPKETITDSMYSEVLMYMDNVLEKHEASQNKIGVSLNHEIVIQLQHPSYPELDLVDLPGIVTNAAAGENASMPSKTVELTKRYLNLHKDHSMFLVVQKSTQDLRQSNVLSLIKEAGLEQRSIGVMTCCDIYHRLDNDLSQLLSKSNVNLVPLGYGWVCTATDHKKQEALQEKPSFERFCAMELYEEEEFKSDSESIVWGIANLVKAIIQSYNNFLARHWIPEANSRLLKHYSLLEEQMSDLGVPFLKSELTEELCVSALPLEQLKDHIICESIELLSRTSIIASCEKWWTAAAEPMKESCLGLKHQLHNHTGDIDVKHVRAIMNWEDKIVSCLREVKAKCASHTEQMITKSCLKPLLEDSSKFKMSRFKRWITELESVTASSINSWLEHCDSIITMIEEQFSNARQENPRTRVMTYSQLDDQQTKAFDAISLACMQALESGYGMKSSLEISELVHTSASDFDEWKDDANEQQRNQLLMKMKKLRHASRVLEQHAQQLDLQIYSADELISVELDEKFLAEVAESEPDATENGTSPPNVTEPDATENGTSPPKTKRKRNRKRRPKKVF